MLTLTDKYKKFEEVYGTATTKKDLPSLQGCGNQAVDELSKQLLVVGKVCSRVMCGE